MYKAFSIILTLVMLQCASIRLQGKKYRIETRDSWRLTLEHLPAKPAVSKKYPVIFVHGFMANRKSVKVAEKKSLAYQLQRQGYDVWLLDLRGREDARRVGWFSGKHTYTYSLDDYVRHDLDRAISFVTEQTGRPKVNVIGHSMGGLIPYIAIGTYNESRIANLVTIASPGMMTPANRGVTFMYKMKGGMVMFPVMPIETLSHTAGFFHMPPIPKEVAITLYNPKNLSNKVENKLMRKGVNNVSKKVLHQFIRAIQTGSMYSADGKINYTKNLVNIKIPVLAIAGRKDNFVTTSNVRYTYSKIGSADKTMKIIGRATGARSDYGHTDLVVGKRVHKEVNPIIINWLARGN